MEGGGHRELQTPLLEGARSTRTRTHPQAIALMPPHSCNGHPSNRTRSNRDAKGQPPPPWTKPPTCATDPLRLSSPLSQTHHHTKWSGQPARGSPQTRPQSSGMREPPNSGTTQCHWTHNITHTQRLANPCTYPHLGGSVGRGTDGLVSGGRRAGSGAGSGWWASAAPAPRWERASVGPWVPPHRGCGGWGLCLLICPRPRGEAAQANQERL